MTEKRVWWSELLKSLLFLNAELWDAGRWTGTDVASAGTEKEETGFPHATAGVHHLESAERREQGEMAMNALSLVTRSWSVVKTF